jgi:hypothetical protein
MKTPLTSYDRVLAGRALVLGMAFSVLLAVLIASTDEGDVTLGARAGRFASLAALAGGLAAFVTAQQARSRGELRALGALGVGPSRAPLGAALGGMLVAAAGPLLVSFGAVDVGGLYPRLGSAGQTWAWVGPATWRRVSDGLIVRAGGELDVSRLPVAGLALAVPELSRSTTSAVLLAFAVAVPLWAVASGKAVRRFCVGLGVAMASVALLHWVAAARAPSVLLAVPPLGLVLDAWASAKNDAHT